MRYWNRWRWLATHIAIKHGDIGHRDAYVQKVKEQEARKAA